MIKTEEEYWNERYNQEEFQMKIYYQDIGYQATRPSTIYKPNLTIDGNMWCALYGDNLQEGVAGFGKSPSKAYEDFDKNWNEELK
ncbi:MAG: hypothetical protein K0Q53_130 [Massilibacillus sp.]|jgi:hypothetical protein|nr:hypothetical protein [Massilibacillus sp.]